jgi:hypothetical protein
MCPVCFFVNINHRYILLFALLRAEEIIVDPDNFELTEAPFKVYRAFDMVSAEDENIKYEGFVIEMEVDVRDVIGTKGDEQKNIKAIPPFPFTHRVYRDEETIVTAPLLDFGARNDIEQRIDLLKRQDQARTEQARRRDANAPVNEDNRPIYEALQDGFNKFIDRYKKSGQVGEDSQSWQTATKQYVLKFPSGVHLSGEVLACNEGKKDLELKSQGQMYYATIEKIDQKRTILHEGMNYDVTFKAESLKGKLMWMVADLNQRQRKIGKMSSAEMDAQTDAAASMLESMGLS